MTELNSRFTRNQFRRSTAARLFTLPAILHTAFCLASIWCWSACIISTSTSFAYAQDNNTESEVKWITYRKMHFGKEHTMLKRNASFNSGQYCSNFVRNACTLLCSELKYKFSIQTSTRQSPSSVCADPVTLFWRRFKSKALRRHDGCSILTDVSEEPAAAISGHVSLSVPCRQLWQEFPRHP